MKILLLALSLVLATARAHADSLICALEDVRDSDNRVEMTIDLKKSMDDYEWAETGVDIGKENYSFMMQVEGDGSEHDVSVVFVENNHVQDEVSSGGWTIDLTSAKDFEEVLHEDLTDKGRKIMEFSCRYKK